MAILNALPSEVGAIVGKIDPDANTAQTYLSDAVDMGKFGRLMAIIQAGTLGASATLDATLQSATTSGGSYSNITGKVIVQLTQAGSDSDKVVIINLRSDEIPVGDRFVKLSMVVGTATSDCSAIVIGYQPRFGPGSDDDIATVDEIVS